MCQGREELLCMLIPSSAAVPEDHSQPAAVSSSLCTAVPSQKVAFHPSLPLTDCPKKPSGCSQLSQAPGAAELFLQTLWPPGAQQTDGLWIGCGSHGHTACHQASHDAPRVQPSIPDRMRRMQITEHVAISLPTLNLQHPEGGKVHAPVDKPCREHEHAVPKEGREVSQKHRAMAALKCCAKVSPGSTAVSKRSHN